MTFHFTRTVTMGLLALSLAACSTSETPADNEPASLSQTTLAAITTQGFSTQNAYAVAGGVIVEGDIFLSDADLRATPERQLLRVGAEEQYRTTNLVRGLPRTISIYVSTSLPSGYVTATDEVVRRYNAENLTLRFRRVTSSTGANIVFNRAPSGAQYLASAGFPTSGGNPFNQVLINTTAIANGSPTINSVATILAHEVGHCIGFRHTDYMGRQFSCGGQAANEGAGTDGAILIPGTPAGPDPNSWMLACVGSGVNRPFNSNDRVALNFLY